MTNTLAPVSVASIVAEFGAEDQQSADIMLGIGLQKDSEAVFFRYEGDDKINALVHPSGKPVTRIGNVYLTGLTIANDIYKDAGFSGDKLNVHLETQNGTTVMLTAGLTTIWSQCIVTSLQGLADEDCLTHLISIDTWKGNSKMKPCFAAVRDGQRKISSNVMYQALADARADRDKAKAEALIRDAVECINALVTGNDIQPAVVADLDDTTTDTDTTEF
jgi:hypothetical protein